MNIKEFLGNDTMTSQHALSSHTNDVLKHRIQKLLGQSPRSDNDRNHDNVEWSYKNGEYRTNAVDLE